MTDAPPSFRRARSADLSDIVRMLADDPLGATRERDVTPLPSFFYACLDPADANHDRAQALAEDAVASRSGLWTIWDIVATR